MPDAAEPPALGPPLPGAENVCCYTAGTLTDPGESCRQPPVYHIIGRTIRDDPEAGWVSVELCVWHVNHGLRAVPVVVEQHWMRPDCPRGSVTVTEFIMAGCLSLATAYPPEMGDPE